MMLCQCIFFAEFYIKILIHLSSFVCEMNSQHILNDVNPAITNKALRDCCHSTSQNCTFSKCLQERFAHKNNRCVMMMSFSPLIVSYSWIGKSICLHVDFDIVQPCLFYGNLVIAKNNKHLAFNTFSLFHCCFFPFQYGLSTHLQALRICVSLFSPLEILQCCKH